MVRACTRMRTGTSVPSTNVYANSTLMPHPHFHADCRSSNGQLLFVSSIDGYVSVLAFGAGELGTPLTPSTGLPAIMQRVHAATFVPKDTPASVRKAGTAEAEIDAPASSAGSGSASAAAAGNESGSALTPAPAPAATINILQPRKRVAVLPLAPVNSAAGAASGALPQAYVPAHFPPPSERSALLQAAAPGTSTPPPSAIDMSGDSRSGLGGEPGQKRRIAPTPVSPATAAAVADVPAKRQRANDAPA